MSRSGNVLDNAAMESFLSSLKTERTASKTYRSRDEAKADVFDYIERFYNPKRRHSTVDYMSAMEFERQPGLAQAGVIQTGGRPFGFRSDEILAQPLVIAPLAVPTLIQVNFTADSPIC